MSNTIGAPNYVKHTIFSPSRRGSSATFPPDIQLYTPDRSPNAPIGLRRLIQRHRLDGEAGAWSRRSTYVDTTPNPSALPIALTPEEIDDLE